MEDDVPHPLKVYPVRVGFFDESVSLSPYHLVCVDGALLPPLALKDTEYDVFADTLTAFVAVNVPSETPVTILPEAVKLCVECVLLMVKSAYPIT